MLPGPCQRVERTFDTLASFQNFFEVLKTVDFNSAEIHRRTSRFPAASRLPTGVLPRNRLALSATDAASPVSPSRVISALSAAFGGCTPKHACGRSPAQTLYPQGVCSIRKAV